MNTDTFSEYLENEANELNKKIEKADKRFFVFCNFEPLKLHDADVETQFWNNVANIYKLIIDCGWLYETIFKHYVKNVASSDVTVNDIRNRLIRVLPSLENRRKKEGNGKGVSEFVEKISAYRTLFSHNISENMGQYQRRYLKGDFSFVFNRVEDRVKVIEKYQNLIKYLDDRVKVYFEWCNNLTDEIVKKIEEDASVREAVYKTVFYWYCSKTTVFYSILHQYYNNNTSESPLDWRNHTYYEIIKNGEYLIKSYYSSYSINTASEMFFCKNMKKEKECPNLALLMNDYYNDEGAESLLPQDILTYVAENICNSINLK